MNLSVHNEPAEINPSWQKNNLNKPKSPKQKILVCITEDWFACSHFLPLLNILKDLSQETVLVTRLSEHKDQLEKLGIRVINFDFKRSNINPLIEVKNLWRFRRLLLREKPDILHSVAMKSIVLGCLAFRFCPAKFIVLHLTGLGTLAMKQTLVIRILKSLSLASIKYVLRKPNARLFIENLEDLDALNLSPHHQKDKVRVLGGAGIDPDEFRELPAPENETPRAAFVGRMLIQKGIYDLISAQKLLNIRGINLHADFYGKTDPENCSTIPEDVLEKWNEDARINWHGFIKDVRAVWQKTDIAVIPSHGREGMPRALLEAAACGRPLVVSDIPGCRTFVRNGVEGFVVPPNDPHALAEALQKMISDKSLRVRMGKAARQRLLDQYTITHFRETISETYLEFA